MRIRNKKVKNGSNETLWFVSYSDLITAILAVLVLVMSFSKIDIEKIDHANRLMNEDKLVTLTELKKEYENIIVKNKLEDLVNVKLDYDGLRIETLSSVQFAVNSAELDENRIKVLNPIMQKIVNDSKSREVFIIGHTDDTGEPERNWELSSQRANNVLLYLMKKGLDYKHANIVAHGSNKPLNKIDVNSSKESIFENRRKNRRVTIKLERSY
nr:OmpA family protein [uncultured Sulfurimonas sp.]